VVVVGDYVASAPSLFAKYESAADVNAPCTAVITAVVKAITTADHQEDVAEVGGSWGWVGGSTVAEVGVRSGRTLFPVAGVKSAPARNPAATADPATIQGCWRTLTRGSAAFQAVAFISRKVSIIPALA
jgi:hypothetical protein